MSVTVEDTNITRHANTHFKEENVIDSVEKTFRSAQHKLLNGIAIQEGFTEYKIDTELIPSTGGNYLGILYRVAIRGKKGKASEELRLFVKVAADNEMLRKMFPLHDVYCNEMFVYKVLSRLYTDLQVDVNIPEAESFIFTKFYGSIESNYGETIVLDNLSYKNYKVQDRFKCISLEFAKEAIDNLAKFHALSYVLERRDPVYFEEVIKTKKGNMYIDGEGPARIKQYSPKLVENSLKNLENPKYSERLRNFCEDLTEDICKYVKRNKYQVLCHGDYRGNNLLVKYDNDKLTSLIPIDYQLIHYGSPLNDIIYFIFSATDSQFRQLHMDYLFEFYYERLGDFLRYFSYDVCDIYPKKDFDIDVKSHMMMGLVVGVHILQFMLVSEDNAPDLHELGEASFEDLAKSPNDIFLKRYNGIIEDFVRWGYL